MNIIRKLALSLALLVAVAAHGAQFNTRSTAVANVSTTYSATAVSIVLNSGQGATQVPATPCLAYWYNTTDYSYAMDDPFGEVIEVTAVSTDTLTVLRGLCGTQATAKNLAGKSYNLAFATPGTQIAVALQQGGEHKTIGDSGVQSNNFGTAGLQADNIAPSTAGNVASATLGGSTTSKAPMVVVASLQVSAAGVACTAGSTDDTLFTYTLPANTLKNVGDWVRVTSWGTPSSTSTTYKTFFGGTAFVTDGGVASASAVTQSMTVIKTAASTQIVMTNINYHGTTAVIASAAPTTAAITDTSGIVIKFTANSSAATSKGNGMLIEFGGAGGGL